MFALLIKIIKVLNYPWDTMLLVTIRTSGSRALSTKVDACCPRCWCTRTLGVWGFGLSEKNMVKAWSNSFIQITVFCHPIPYTGAFVHRNVRKVFHLSLTSLELDNLLHH